MIRIKGLREQNRGLRGTIGIPGDKSISHRAVMFGALAEGTTRIDGFLAGADCLSTVDCFRKLGIEIDVDGSADRVLVHGKGLHGLGPCPAPDGPAGEGRMTDPSDRLTDGGTPVSLYTGNSGTTTRIISGILAPQPFATLLSGDSSVNSRPMQRVIDPLTQMGADIRSMSGSGCAPLLIRGRNLRGITYRSPVASAQVKSAVLCAGLYADGPTTVIEPVLSRDHTERMLRAFGARVESFPEDRSAAGQAPGAGSGGWCARISPCDRLYAQQILVPGDISSAAYFIAAASIVPGSEVRIRNVGLNPTRAGMLEAARAMGADISLDNYTEGTEPVADLIVRSAPLHGTTIGGEIIPALIDEIPALAVMAAAAEGRTVIRDAAELRVKETDRVATVTENLLAMGADVTPTEDGMVIEGGLPLKGARIRAYGDHRIAMSFAVAALAAEGETVIDDDACVEVSYPGFFKDLLSL